MAVAKSHNLTFNESKCVYNTDTVDLLGYRITASTLQPDPERVKTLQELPSPKNHKEQQRVIGLFAYYAQWIAQYFDKIKPLIVNTIFSLRNEALSSFKNLKSELINVSLGVIDENAVFVDETDASNVAVSATLNQNGKPVAFYSRSLSKSEQTQSSVEKEATAIVEAIRKWNHLLTGRRFRLITDQRPISFMYNSKNHEKIKNAKILRWRIELSQYQYEIIYRAGKLNAAADTLSRAYSVSLFCSSLHDIHAGLCNPGITRTYHFVRSKNLPFSLDDVRKVVNECKICAEIKPKLCKPPEMRLIKATQLMERLSIDFKGPLPSSSKNKYLLTVIDEYSRFPFAFPCNNMESQTVISCLMQIISKWEVILPQVLHSVRSLLCTTTNETSHERFFEFQRRSILGVSAPTRFSSPGTVYVRKHARQSKFEQQVEKADLIHATPQYARVRFGSGREATVSLRDVAPIPDRDWPESDEKQVSSNQNQCNDGNRQNNEDPNRADREIDQPDSDVTSDKVDQSPSKSPSYEETHPEPYPVGQNELVLPRRSSQTRKPPDRLTYYH